MSWDSYIDNGIGQSNDSMDKMCIIGLDGSKWTTDRHSSNFQLSTAEVVTIANAFQSGDFSRFQASGIGAGGIKYQFLNVENGSIVYGKKEGEGAITLQKSITAIVIGHTSEGSQQGNTNKAIGVIADYLSTLGM